MSLLGVIIDWDDPAPPESSLAALLGALPERSPDGRRFARARHALLGFGSRVVRAVERGSAQPVFDRQRRLFAVGDLRLDNRDDVRASLRLDPRMCESDLAVLLAAYERWGYDTAAHLVGDFAFVVWDENRREVYAARDHFGVRSLVYDWKPGRIVLTTEPAQMLALPEFDRSPNPSTVVDHLSWSYAHYGETFFRSARAIPPGHYLRACNDSAREVNYFHPPSELVRFARREEYCEQFRSLLRTAVSDRIDSAYPIVAHLSGGLDSSSIVCTADRLYRDSGSVRPPLHLGSATFAGQPYDEAPFIDQVATSVGFVSHRWDGNEPSGREVTHPSLSIPGGSVTFNSGSTGDVELAQRLGARVILSGDPGDFVTGEMGLFNELVAKGRWLELGGQLYKPRRQREREIR